MDGNQDAVREVLEIVKEDLGVASGDSRALDREDLEIRREIQALMDEYAAAKV